MINERLMHHMVFKMDTLLETDNENLINTFISEIKRDRDPFVATYTVLETNILVIRVSRRIHVKASALLNDYGSLKRIKLDNLLDNLDIDN